MRSPFCRWLRIRRVPATSSQAATAAATVAATSNEILAATCMAKLHCCRLTKMGVAVEVFSSSCCCCHSESLPLVEGHHRLPFEWQHQDILISNCASNNSNSNWQHAFLKLVQVTFRSNTHSCNCATPQLLLRSRFTVAVCKHNRRYVARCTLQVLSQQRLAAPLWS